MFINRNAIATMGSMRGEIDGLFNRLFDCGPRPITSRVRVNPPLNVWEDGDAIYVESELPGLTGDDVEIFAEGNELTIKGDRQSQSDDEVRYLRRERSFGQFARSITLPYEVEVDRVEATLNNGVLTVKLPKAESLKPRRISVAAG